MRELIVMKMKRAGIKPKQMAKAFGITERTWYNWLADPQEMTMRQVNTIANILGFTEEERRELWSIC